MPSVDVSATVRHNMLCGGDDVCDVVFELLQTSVVHHSALPTVRTAERNNGVEEQQIIRRPTILHAVAVRHVKSQMMELCKQILTANCSKLQLAWFRRLHAAALWREILAVANSIIPCNGLLTVDLCRASLERDRLRLHNAQVAQIRSLRSQQWCQSEGAPILLYSTERVAAHAGVDGSTDSLTTAPKLFACPYCADDVGAVSVSSATPSSVEMYVCLFCVVQMLKHVDGAKFARSFARSFARATLN